MTEIKTVAFVGLGAMGRGMTGCLLKSGFTVRGYDLSDTARAWLTSQGGIACASSAEACANADALIIMTVNGEQAEAVLFGGNGALGALPTGHLVLSGVTMPPDEAERIGTRAEMEGGWLYLDSPVSGGAIGAEKGTLTIMASGSDAAWTAAGPLLDSMGKNIYRLGDKAGPGSIMKMVHQLAAGCNLAVAAEVMSFGTHLGIEPKLLLEILLNSAGQSWMIGNRGPGMIDPPDGAKSAVDIFVKDLGIVLDAARTSRFPVPVSAAALQVFLGASSAGFGKADDSQAVKFYESLGGKRIAKS